MALRARQNKTSTGEKRRWTSDDRARRADGTPRDDAPRGSRAGAGASRAARRAEQFGDRRPTDRDERRTPAADRAARPDRRTDWYPGPRDGGPERRDTRGAGRPERPGRDDRRGADRFGRPERADRPVRPQRDEHDRPRSFDQRSDRPERRMPEQRTERTFRENRPQRDDRPQRDTRSFRDDRPQRGDRPFRPERDDRAAGDRPNREDRPRRDDRPVRESRPFREDRPQQADRSFGHDRPRRDDRPVHTGRPVERPRSFEADRPRRDDRPARRPAERDERRPYAADRMDPRRERPRHDAPQRDERGPAAWTPPEDVVLERLEAETVTADEVAGSSFAELGLGEGITRALAELGAERPFPIQAATIPDALAGRDVLGRGRTGSGKTIAFGAALVERLMRNWHASGRAGSGRQMGRAPRALILAPTRELALQIDRTVQPIARSIGLYTTQIVGGVPQGRQVGALQKGVDIVIGTPGRIEDLIEQRRLDLGSIEITVLDEADHMAELGFLEPMRRLLRRIPTGGQRLMFSATLDAAVSTLVDEFLVNPAVHEVAEAADASTTAHRVLVIEQGEKLPVLKALLESVDRSLVFARTRAFAEQLADDLEDLDVRAESLHGDLNQARRTRALARFSEGRVQAMVATDVAARGIHVDEIDLVVHADSAEDYKTYLHRSGRTGRAGAAGTVVTLITARRRRRFTELLERAEIEADFVVVRPGQDPVAALAR